MNKGVILAGGKGTRLLPITRVTNKHLVPILNKPMILFPIETLKELKVKDILIVSGGENIGDFADFLGDGSDYGVSLTYRVQQQAGGIAEALFLAKDFVRKEVGFPVILGDNIFDNQLLPISSLLNNTDTNSAQVVLAEVPNPNRFGVPVFHKGSLVEIEEKPENPKSSYAVTGLYVYPQDVFEVIKQQQPSERGELEITDVNNFYIEQRRMNHNFFKGFWSDAGTTESLFNTINWVYKWGTK